MLEEPRFSKYDHPALDGFTLFDNGTIKEDKTGKFILIPNSGKLSRNGSTVHNLGLRFCELFVPLPVSGTYPYVVHVDGNLQNHHFTNLKWSETNDDFKWKSERKEFYKCKDDFELYYDAVFKMNYKIHDMCPTMKWYKNGTRCWQGTLYDSSSDKYATINNNFPISRIMIELWGAPKPEGKYEIDHVDGNPCNNDMSAPNKFGRIGNLEYVTHSENMRRLVLTLISKNNMTSISDTKSVGNFVVRCKKQYLGTYETLEKAITVRDGAVGEYNWEHFNEYKTSLGLNSISEKGRLNIKRLRKERVDNELLKCDIKRENNEEIAKGSWTEYPKHFLKIDWDEVCPGKEDKEACYGKHAHVYSIATEKKMFELNTAGYVFTQITDSIRGRNKRVYVHHFGAFIREGRGRGMHEEIRHLDGNAAHNAPCNLKYGTRKENVADKIIHRKRKLELKEELKERKKGRKEERIKKKNAFNFPTKTKTKTNTI